MINPKKKNGKAMQWPIQHLVNSNTHYNAKWQCNMYVCVNMHMCAWLQRKINDLCMDLAYSGPIWTWLDLRTGLIITKHGVELLGHPNEGGTTTQLFQLSSTHICAGGTNSTQHISHRHLHRPFVRHFNGFTLWCPENTIMTANINDLKIVLNQNTWF